MNGAADPLIGPATADVAAHRLIDVGVGGPRILAQEYSGGHDLPRLAVTTLRHVLLDPGALQRMAEIGREALDRGDLFAGGARDGRDARSHGLAVEMDRARSAEGHPAAEFRSC